MNNPKVIVKETKNAGKGLFAIKDIYRNGLLKSMINQKYKETLKILESRLRNGGINWAVFGSTNLLLRGMKVEPNDIDILTDVDGAYKIENLFPEYIIKKVSFSSNGKVESHWGGLGINGVKVDIVGDFRSSIDLQPIAVLDSEEIEFDGIKLPCLKLENELFEYQRLGRPEKIKVVKKYLER